MLMRSRTTAMPSACITFVSMFPREVVDERAQWLQTHAARIESGPAEYDYTPGYYAVFFYDPDGIKLELLHRPTYWATD